MLLINIFDSRNIDEANNFLFKIIFTQSFKYKENIFIINENVKIVIELPFGFIDFKEKNSILSFFTIKTININNLPFICETEENEFDNLNIICTYLKLDDDKINNSKINLKYEESGNKEQKKS